MVKDVTRTITVQSNTARKRLGRRVMHLGKALAREWRSIEIKAERKWGQLLGEANHGGDRRSDQVSPADLKSAEKEARSQARRLAAVPEEVFEEYVETAEQPSKAGLLRAAEIPDPQEAEPVSGSRRFRATFHCTVMPSAVLHVRPASTSTVVTDHVMRREQADQEMNTKTEGSPI